MLQSADAPSVEPAHVYPKAKGDAYADKHCIRYCLQKADYCFHPVIVNVSLDYICCRAVMCQYTTVVQRPAEHRAVGNTVGAFECTAIKISKLDKPVEVRRVQRFVVRNGFLKIPPDVPIAEWAHYCEGRGKPVNCVLFLLC